MTALDRAQQVALAEQTEAEFMFQYEAGTPAETAAALGITTHRLEDGVVTVMRDDPAGGYWNKALGFTVITDDLIGRILDLYRAGGSAVAALQFAPELLPADWPEIAARHGLVEGGAIVKVMAPIDDLPADEAKTDLRIAAVAPEDAPEWGRVVGGTFGMLDGIEVMLAASIDNPRFHPYAAWDGDRIVGGANLYVHNSAAALNAGAVAASHRNRGAQSALIAARIAAARAAGCRWVVAEAAKPAPGQSNPSLNNLIRAGLSPLYDRSNWVWRA